jgi:hypothetical protein
MAYLQEKQVKEDQEKTDNHKQGTTGEKQEIR